MTEPVVTLRTAVRGVLLASPAVTDLVSPNSIRLGPVRPEKMPCIIMGNGQTQNLGYNRDVFISRVWIGLDIWAIEDGAETAHQIGAAVAAALWDDPIAATNDHSNYIRPSFQWLRDPQPEKSYTHGVATLETVIRWTM